MKYDAVFQYTYTICTHSVMCQMAVSPSSRRFFGGTVLSGGGFVVTVGPVMICLRVAGRKSSEEMRPVLQASAPGGVGTHTPSHVLEDSVGDQHSPSKWRGGAGDRECLPLLRFRDCGSRGFMLERAACLCLADC